MKKANHGAIDAAQLTSYVERVEKLTNDIKALNEDIKEILSEAKSSGYDAKYIRLIVKLRAQTQEQIEENDELESMYRNALGI